MFAKSVHLVQMNKTEANDSLRCHIVLISCDSVTTTSYIDSAASQIMSIRHNIYWQKEKIVDTDPQMRAQHMCRRICGSVRSESETKTEVR